MSDKKALRHKRRRKRILDIKTRLNNKHMTIVTNIDCRIFTSEAEIIYLDFICDLLPLLRSKTYLTLDELYQFAHSFVYDEYEFKKFSSEQYYAFLEEYSLQIYYAVHQLVNYVTADHILVGYIRYGKNVELIFDNINRGVYTDIE